MLEQVRTLGTHKTVTVGPSCAMHGSAKRHFGVCGMLWSATEQSILGRKRVQPSIGQGGVYGH